MHGYTTTTTVTPTVHGPEAYTWPQPRPGRTSLPVSANSDSESSSSSGPPVLSGQRDVPAQRVRRCTTSRTPSCQSSSDALGVARQLADSIQNQLQQADARELRLQKDSQDRELRTAQALEKQRDDNRDREQRAMELELERERRADARESRLFDQFRDYLDTTRSDLKDAALVREQQEAQLMLTTGSTRLIAVSRARAISDGTVT